MARIRSIKPEFFSHELLASKSAHARLLAIGLLTLADCKGRLRWVPMQVHAQVFPWEASVKIQVLLGELLDASYVVHYEHDGKQYVEIVNFLKHQRLSGKELKYESRLPPPHENTTNNELKPGCFPVKHLDASQGSVGNPLGTEEHRNIGTEEYNAAKSPRPHIVSEKTPACQLLFEQFWKAYPQNDKGRKRGKAVSLRIWKTIAVSDRELVIAAAKNYAREQTEFVRDPERFLKSDWWRDWTCDNESTPMTVSRVATKEQMANYNPNGPFE